MSTKRLDRLGGSGNTVNVATTTLTTFATVVSSIVQLRTRVIGANTAGTPGTNFGIGAVVTATYSRAAGGPVIVGSVTVDDLQTDSGLSGCVLTYSVSSNNILFTVTGVSSTTLNWLATTRPLVWIP